MDLTGDMNEFKYVNAPAHSNKKTHMQTQCCYNAIVLLVCSVSMLFTLGTGTLYTDSFF